MRRGAKPVKARVEAKPAVAGKPPKNDGSRIRDLEKRLAEALEQQTATAEILKVISRSPTDLQPVLDATARNASRLCGAANVSLYRVEGPLMRKVAEQGPPLTTLRVGETRAIARTSVSGRVILDRTTIHLPDYQSAEATREYPESRRDTGIRTTIGIPSSGKGSPSAPSPRTAPNPGRSRSARSRCSRPSPTRRRSRSRTSACSTRPRRRSSSRRRRPGSCA